VAIDSLIFFELRVKHRWNTVVVDQGPANAAEADSYAQEQ